MTDTNKTTVEFEVSVDEGLAEEVEYGLTYQDDSGWLPAVMVEWPDGDGGDRFRLTGEHAEIGRVLEERWAPRAKAEGLRPGKWIVVKGVPADELVGGGARRRLQ